MINSIIDTPILNWFRWKMGFTPVIPKFYYDAYSQEEIIKELAKELDALCNYANYLGENQNLDRETINQTAEVLNQLQEGGWFETYADQIKAWIQDIHNLQEMVQEEVTEQVTPIVAELTENISQRLNEQDVDIANFKTQVNTQISTFDDRVTANTERSIAAIEKLNNTQNGLFVAHRGAQHCYPENTVAAIKMAGQLMCDAVEFDVHITSDEQAVVMHDASLASYTNTSGNAETSTLATIQAAPITKGTWTNYVTTALVGTHYIPSLQQVLDECQKWPFKQVYIELKSQTQWTTERAQLVYDMVKKHDMLNRVTFSSFSRSPLLRMKEIDVSARTQILLAEPTFSQIELEKSYGIDCVGFPYAYGQDMVAYANSLDMPVLVYALTGAGSAGEVLATWNVEASCHDSMVYLGRLSGYASMQDARNRYLGDTYLAPTKFVRMQGDAKRWLPIEGVPYMGGDTVSSTGIAPIWYGQTGRMAKPLIALPIGTLVRIKTMGGRYRIALRTFAEDFSSYNDSGWITTDSIVGVVASTMSSVGGNAWVSFVASRGDGSTTLCELDAIWLDTCVEILGTNPGINMRSIKDGAINGVGYLTQYSQTRIMSDIIPIANGGVIRFKPIDEMQQSAYVFGNNGKRVIDTGFQTYTAQTDYTVNNANAAYFRYVWAMADSSAKINAAGFGKVASTYEQIG